MCHGCKDGDCNPIGICQQGCNPRFIGEKCDSKYHLIVCFLSSFIVNQNRTGLYTHRTSCERIL